MGNAVDPLNILEQIKRTRLYNPNFGAGQSSTSIPQQAQNQLPSPTQNPAQQTQASTQSPRDQALTDYRQTLQQGEPSQADYHPSITRRVIGGLLGAGVGITNPQAGAQLANKTVYGPYQQQLTDYQKKLAQKKEAYETEAGAQKESSLEQEQLARTSAEGERAKAETARKLGEEGKLRSLQPGTPEYAAELEKLKIQHPNTPKPPVPYELELNNGESVVGYEGQSGQFKDAEGNIYGTDAIKNARKVGTTIPKETTLKPPREGEAGDIDQWTKERGRAPNYSERQKIESDRAKAMKTPANPEEADFRRELQMTNAKQAANKSYGTQLDEVNKHLERIDQTKLEISKGTPESIAIAVPSVLTALISGQGSGFRMTQAEINQIIHARGWGDSIEAFTNKIRGLGSLSTQQKKDLSGILDDVSKAVTSKQKELHDTMDDIDNAKEPQDISKAHINHRKRVTGGTNETPRTDSAPETKPKTKEDFLKLLETK